MKAKHPITCQKCGIVDQTRKDAEGNTIIGTDKTMRCSDCGNPHATLCRKCCPTEHGTRPTNEDTK
jgi:hypothetical protein